MASLTNPATEEAQPNNVEELNKKLEEALIYAEQMGVQSETTEKVIEQLKKKLENLRAQLQQANSVSDNLKIIISALEEDKATFIYRMIKKKQWNALMFALENVSEYCFEIQNQDPTSLSISLYTLVSDYCQFDIVQCVKLIVEQCGVTKEIATNAYNKTNDSLGWEHGWEAIEEIKNFLKEKFSF